MSRRQLSLVLSLVSLLIFLALLIYQSEHQQTVTQSAQAQVAAVVASFATTTLDEQTALGDCHVHGPYPDHTCTPGAVFDDTLETICVSGYSKSVRNVSTSLKKKVYAAYHISYPQPTGSYELDHLIPLAIGGNNESANLFPEIAEPRPGFHEKDIVENYLHEEVCAGRMDLHAAQVAVAEDWVAIYKALTPETIQRLRQKYQNWSD